MIAGLLGVAPAAQAATPFVAHLVEPTVLAGTPAIVTGTAPPIKAALSVQRLVGRKWLTVAHTRVSSHGTWSAPVRTAHAAGVWSLRVTGGHHVSKTLRLRLTKVQYLVQATSTDLVEQGQAITIVGSVNDKALGRVQVQLDEAGVWTTIASPVLTSASGFEYNATARVPGAYEYRVVKPWSPRIATGISPTFDVLVTPPLPPAPPIITTPGLPMGTAELPYAATLSATDGVAPFAWSITGGQLPPGLLLTPAGVLSGTPTAAASAPVTVTVIDALGRSVSVGLTVTIGLSPVHANVARSWGGNSHQQLGDGSTANSDTPGPVSALAGVTAVAGGSQSAYALRFNGAVWAWGSNASGQLGDGTTTDRATPVQVSGLTGVTAISAGGQAAYALRGDGTVWAWGSNLDGQLGNGATADSATPVQVSGLTGVTAIAGSLDSAYALKSDGTVWAWGSNSDQQLGTAAPASSNLPLQVPGLAGVKAIAGGDTDGYAVLNDGSVRAWGDDSHGQLGAGATHGTGLVVVTGLGNVTALAAGHDFALALQSTGSVMAWGAGTLGQLGGESNADADEPTQVADVGTAAAAGTANVTAIAAGSSTGYALLADHAEVAWGAGGSGQLGGAAVVASSNTPSAVGTLSTITAIGAGGTTGYAVTSG